MVCGLVLTLILTAEFAQANQSTMKLVSRIQLVDSQFLINGNLHGWLQRYHRPAPQKSAHHWRKGPVKERENIVLRRLKLRSWGQQSKRWGKS